MLAHTTWLDFEQKTSQGESACLSDKSAGAYYSSMRRASWSKKGPLPSQKVFIITADFIWAHTPGSSFKLAEVIPPRGNMILRGWFIVFLFHIFNDCIRTRWMPYFVPFDVLLISLVLLLARATFSCRICGTKMWRWRGAWCRLSSVK